jgi:hypothetical protein
MLQMRRTGYVNRRQISDSTGVKKENQRKTAIKNGGMTGDITNRQLLDELTDQLGVISDNMVVKKDVEEIVEEIVGNATKGLATKDELNSAVLRLESKLDSHQKATVSHHLETRAEIGNLNKELGQMREGLAQAAGLT